MVEKQVRIPPCVYYTTTGYPSFEPVCILEFKASLKCHSKNLWCSQYKPCPDKLKDKLDG